MIFVDIVRLVTVTLTLGGVKHLSGRAVAGGQQAGAATRRPMVLQLYTPTRLEQ